MSDEGYTRPLGGPLSKDEAERHFQRIEMLMEFRGFLITAKPAIEP